jgi:branched-chain amino acid transport system permease protein
MIAAIGILLFLEAGAQALWGRLPPHAHAVWPDGRDLRPDRPLQRLLIIVAAFGLMVLLHLFLTRTVTGSTIVAMAQNREGAALVGIDATRVTLLCSPSPARWPPSPPRSTRRSTWSIRAWATWSSPRRS